MGRRCGACAHPDSRRIDRELREAQAALRALADRFALSQTALRRHRAHLPPETDPSGPTGVAGEVQGRVRELLERLEALQTRAAGVMQQASAEADHKTAMAAMREFVRLIGEGRAQLTLLLRVAAAYPERSPPDPLTSPAFIAVRTRILEALEAHPEAKRAVEAALWEQGEGAKGTRRAAHTTKESR